MKQFSSQNQMQNKDNFSKTNNFTVPPSCSIVKTDQNPKDFYDSLSDLSLYQFEEKLGYFRTKYPIFINSNCFTDEYNFLVVAQIVLILAHQKSHGRYITFDNSPPRQKK
ncbi:hypothetical protein M9Y10_030214 [Tritrichomonas musculus]|uniref:Initiator binding domain-containing protein n=1 Tax=Tritrichomonas musculus TaxID=1915356 RepID=A0ABR2KPB5_9EUKA